jgi:hypothetical protein
LPEEEAGRILILAPKGLREQRQLAVEWAEQIKAAQALENAAQSKRNEAAKSFIDSLNNSLKARRLPGV